MTNINKLTGAIALLALIAVLDNFIFVEPDPDFEEMVLIAADASQAEVGDVETNPDPFWIDTREVSHANFAKFVASTGYQAETMPGKNEWPLAASGLDLPRTPTTDAIPAQQHSQSTASNDSFVQVNYTDALAYCKWLGKDLPSDLQVKFAARAGREREGIPDGLQSLHHRTLSKTWIGGKHELASIVNAGSTTEERELSPGNTNAYEFLGFLCVRNVESVKD